MFGMQQRLSGMNSEAGFNLNRNILIVVAIYAFVFGLKAGNFFAAQAHATALTENICCAVELVL